MVQLSASLNHQLCTFSSAHPLLLQCLQNLVMASSHHMHPVVQGSIVIHKDECYATIITLIAGPEQSYQFMAHQDYPQTTCLKHQ